MRVYLDNSASSPLLPEVLESMLPFFSGEFGNAQSVHSFGQRARAAVENARRHVAKLIGANPNEIVFLSGGTEADNLAIRGVCYSHSRHGHIITSSIEHPAVLATCQELEQAGFRVTWLPVNRNGLINTEDLRDSIDQDTVLVSVMQANNETGVIQPIREIAGIVDEARSRGINVRLHTDAVQSTGKIRIDVRDLGVDLLSISAHKFHGPKGVGALYVKKGTRLSKQITGGHHERDRRAGTENVSGIVGFGRAAEIAYEDREKRENQMRSLRDALEKRLLSMEQVQVNGIEAPRLSNISNLSFAGVDGESLLIALDLKGIAVSTGSACASGSLEPSHVLTAMGLSREEVRGSLRFSLSSLTTEAEIEYAASAVEDTVLRLRAMSPENGSGVEVPVSDSGTQS